MVKSIAEGTKRGIVGTLILMALTTGDKYGYEIIKEIESKSKGEYSIKQPSLYSALKRMKTAGHVSSYWQDSKIGGRRHYYKILDSGINKLREASFKWPDNTEFVNTIFDGQSNQNNKDTPKAKEDENTNYNNKGLANHEDKKEVNPISYTISKPTIVNDEIIYPKPNPNQNDMFSELKDTTKTNKLDSLLLDEKKDNSSFSDNMQNNNYKNAKAASTINYENEIKKFENAPSHKKDLNIDDDFKINSNTNNEESFIAKNYSANNTTTNHYSLSKAKDSKYKDSKDNNVKENENIDTDNDAQTKPKDLKVKNTDMSDIKENVDHLKKELDTLDDNYSSESNNIDFKNILGDLGTSDPLNTNNNDNESNQALSNEKKHVALPRIHDKNTSVFLKEKSSDRNNHNLKSKNQNNNHNRNDSNLLKSNLYSQKNNTSSKSYQVTLFSRVYQNSTIYKHIKYDKKTEPLTRYVSSNKLNAANSFIMLILMVIQLISAHIIITNRFGNNTINNATFFASMLFVFSICMYFSLKYLIYPNKKTKLEIDLKNKITNNFILIVIISIFIYSLNLIMGMNPQNIYSFIASLALPLLLVLNLLIYPFTRLLLLTQKKFYK